MSVTVHGPDIGLSISTIVFAIITPIFQETEVT